ncbi:UNKNOWN [Stylonychia lemnae]|uniref:Uncharacterized protein n=1 Tax=Stylonychia lemnae TaxID=5949 RepID=A0A078ARA6_STYLE|nr:UNKNOWN [Stylonychia lemnae]|eukprot:CDW84970.1 UNKNOWN [Stylonychia lemnae]
MKISQDKKSVTLLDGRIIDQKSVQDGDIYMRNFFGQFSDATNGASEFELLKLVKYQDCKFEEGILGRVIFEITITKDMKDSNNFLLRELLSEFLDFMPLRATDCFDKLRPMNTVYLSTQFLNKVAIDDKLIFQGEIVKVGEKIGQVNGRMIDPVSKLSIATCQNIFMYQDYSPKL